MKAPPLLLEGGLLLLLLLSVGILTGGVWAVVNAPEAKLSEEFAPKSTPLPTTAPIPIMSRSTSCPSGPPSLPEDVNECCREGMILGSDFIWSSSSFSRLIEPLFWSEAPFMKVQN
ncbi:hypothetical protein Mapa_008536 [Marchantia paleacea]|nr:hypothetical protein Mapa_008536 [Marchantia paleacea]